MTTVVATLTLMTTLSFPPGAPGRPTVTGQQNPPATQTAASIDADAIRQRVKEGQKVRVTDDQGREWQGRIETFAADNWCFGRRIVSAVTCRIPQSSGSTGRATRSPTARGSGSSREPLSACLRSLQ